MKTKIISCFSIVILLASSCKNNYVVEANQASYERDSVIALVKIKDSILTSFLTSFAEIEDNLVNIQRKENLLSNKPKSFGELNQNTKNNINEDIAAINELLEKNKKTIDTLNNKLHKLQVKIGSLDKLIITLNSQLQDKTQELEELYAYLATKNSTINKLNTSVISLLDQSVLKSDIIHEQDIKLNKAYYLSGNYKELKAKKLIDKKGGFLGLGKKKILKQDFNTADFKAIDIRHTTTIPILSKNAKLLTNHPLASYKLERNDKKMITDLVITDPDSFWKESKYLVVVVD